MSSSEVPKRRKSTNSELTRLLSKADDITLPTGTEFHTLVELGMIQNEKELENVKESFESLVTQIDETLICILSQPPLQDLKVSDIRDQFESNDSGLDWISNVYLDRLYDKLDERLNEKL